MSQRRPAVLMVVPNYFPYLGGLERQAHTLGAALVRQGCRVTVLTRRLRPELPGSELLDGVRVVRLPTRWRGVGSRDLLFPAALAAMVACLAPRYSVIHVHAKSWFILGCIPAAQLWGKPVLVKLPNVRERGLPGMFKQRMGAQLVGLLRRADAWVALSAESRAELTAAHFPPERIFQIYNGVDVRHYTPAGPVDRAQLRGEFGLPQRATVALFAGRLTRQKGVPDMLAAWGRARSAAPDALLVICGDGPQRAELEGLATSAGLNNVRFVGASERMADWYRAADLFVLPSYAEGNSNALLEAMACGLPTLASAVGGTAELIGPEAADLLFQPGDVDALTSKLASLLADGNARRRLGATLAARVRERFAIDVIAGEYITCYRQLAAGLAPDDAALAEAHR